jgi:twinkle protein
MVNEVKVINPETKTEYTIDVNKTGENTILCPVCSHTRKKKTLKCFGFNLKKGAGKCNHCGVVLVSVKEESNLNRFRNEYKRPLWKNSTELSDKVVKWFEGRKISQFILKEYKVTEGQEWMPQTQKLENTIQFNYFRFGEIINVKYRTGAKHFKMFKDGEMIFYNLDATLTHKEIIIVEGEMDVLALAQCGIKNVISVPNGCTEKGNINLEYLDNCIDFFDDETKFILALDNDLVGNRLKNELARRLGIENCYYVTFKDCKDANDCLIKYGTVTVSECIDEKKEFPIEGVFTAEDIREQIIDFYQNGLPTGDGIGMGEFDMHLKFQPGYITTITGIPGHGKSEFLDFILVRLNISHQWKHALYSPENHPMQLHFSKFAEKITGKSWEGASKLSPIDLQQTIDYHSKNFFFINPKEDFTLDSILASVKSLVRKKGIKSFVIDAWNKLEHHYTVNETKYISEQLDKIDVFCQRNNVHCFLVVHPIKIQKDKVSGLYEVPNLYSISGSANWYNKTANGMTVYRNMETGQTEIYIQKVKFKHWGQTGTIHFGWDRKNGRYYKGMPNDDNWLHYLEKPNLEVNNEFLQQGIVVDDGEPPVF